MLSHDGQDKRKLTDLESAWLGSIFDDFAGWISSQLMGWKWRRVSREVRRSKQQRACVPFDW